MPGPSTPVPQRTWRRLMVGRDAGETHRGVTPLELLVDLCFVVAVAQAAAQLRNDVLGGTLLEGVLGYVLIFGLIWWAWVSFTWFASAYDTDDVPFRLLTLVHLAGVLILASGVPGAVSDHDLRTVTVGYVTMRIVMVAHWLRAAAEHPAGRGAAVRYAAGIGLCQAVALTAVVLPFSWTAVVLAAVVGAEIMVPLWAESQGGPTPWHPAHISERYGLFSLIVLGQSVAAAAVALHSAVTDRGVSGSLLMLAGGALLLLFGLWWSYFEFKDAAAPALRSPQSSAPIWAYSHFGVFSATAALGAGLEVAANSLRYSNSVPAARAAFIVAIPVAVYLVLVDRLHAYMNPEAAAGSGSAIATAALVLLCAAGVAILPLAGAVAAMGVCLAGHIARNAISAHRREYRRPMPDQSAQDSSAQDSSAQDAGMSQ